MNDNKFITLSYNEMEDINGGIAWVPVIVIGGLVVSAVVSAYNGYQEAKWENS